MGSPYLAGAGRPESNYTYCNNEQHAFMESTGFNYTMPQCQFIIPEQLVIKGKGQVQVVTQYLENRYTGWPCSSTVDANNSKACGDAGGVRYEQASGQCFCKTYRSVYPVGIDDMVVQFDHTFSFPNGLYELKSWAGTSTLDDKQAKANSDVSTAVKSEIEFDGEGSTDCWGASNKKCVKFDPGTTVTLSVGDWLKAAGTSLDDINIYAGVDKMGRTDANGQPREPFNRMTGVVLEILIKYTNGVPSLAPRKTVSAQITSQRKLLAWAGPGSQRIHIQYPTGPYGGETFDYIDRYAQGVQFDFQPTGLVYTFDYYYLINTLAVAFIMLGVASTITDFIAFFCLPDYHSKVLNSYRFQVVTKRSGFSELGMKTALAALHFKAFDPDNNKSIEAEDIVRVLAQVSFDDSDEIEMDYEKAHALALTIIRDQVISGEKPLWKDRALQTGPPDQFSFIDYMGTQDNGSIPFPDFIKRIHMPVGGSMGDVKPTDEEVRRCKQAFEEGRRVAVGDRASELRQRGTAYKAAIKESTRRRTSAAKGSSTNVADVVMYSNAAEQRA